MTGTLRLALAFSITCAVVLVTVVVLEGWADESAEAFVRDGPVVASTTEPTVGPLALIGGELEIAAGCSRVGGSAVVWPAGTTWNDDAEAVVLKDGSLVRDGATVESAGGFAGGDATFDDGEAARVLGACLIKGREVGFMYGPISVSVS